MDDFSFHIYIFCYNCSFHVDNDDKIKPQIDGIMKKKKCTSKIFVGKCCISYIHKLIPEAISRVWTISYVLLFFDTFCF